ncbi:DPP IV N-terminal domain-containing protein [Pedobacter glucosidilyticus]|uniref:DPP IV N-terminal domain-containing protein n=1 Tax=Pedobacter glucosidilyticus TaxID=1122941 RepID=UPI0004103B89|nr:DPP IV N-terminal domain-containing protein [Pedobacter glucosidilyticus]
MKNINPLILLIIIVFLTTSCKKNAKDNKGQEPCVGGCGTIDFNIVDYQPAWSPDGKYIAYYHIDKEVAKNGIWLITPDGKENRLWHSGVGAETPTWSPDGQWIAFSQGAQIWKKKLNGDSLTRITNEGRNFFPAWSPDGKWIAYGQSICNATPCGLWIVSASTNSTSFLMNYGNFPTWNPHTMEIIYQTTIVETNGNVLGDSLWVFNLASNKKRGLIALTGKNLTNNYFKYSSNDKIGFTSQPMGGVPQIWLMNADGSNQKQLTQTGGYTSDWSPDGSKIVFTDSRAVNGRLWLMNADGSNKQQLSFAENFNP